MGKKLSTYKYFFLAILLGLVGVLVEEFGTHKNFNTLEYNRFQERLLDKIQLVNSLIEELDVTSFYIIENEIKKEDIIYIKYNNDSLIYWSENSFNIPPDFPDSLPHLEIIRLNNFWCIPIIYVNGNQKHIFLIKVKYNYPYENPYLENSYARGFNLSSSTLISLVKDDHSKGIFDGDGSYLFSLEFTQKTSSDWIIYMALLFYFLAFGLFLFHIRYHLFVVSNSINKNLLLFGYSILLFVWRFAMIKYQWPTSLYQLEIFGPIPFAYSSWLPTLGDVALHFICLSFVLYMFQKEFKLIHPHFNENKKLLVPYLGLLHVLLIAYIFISNNILHKLIINSNIDFELYKIIEININTIICLFIFGLVFLNYLIFLIKLLDTFKSWLRIEQIIFNFSLVYILVTLLCYLFGVSIDPMLVLFYYLITVSVVYFIMNNIQIQQITSKVLLLLAYSLCMVYFMHQKDIERSEKRMEFLAESLASEHDPIAEYLLEDLVKELPMDSMVQYYVSDFESNIENLAKYIKSRFFSGFWEKYSLKITLCTPEYDVYHEEENAWFPCYDFFAYFIDTYGILMPGSGFYYLDNNNGRISYLGIIIFKGGSYFDEVSLFIELDSKLTTDQLGYPNLLLSGQFHKKNAINEYTYARYLYKSLLTKSGDYHYSLDLDVYKEHLIDSEFSKYDGYNHYRSSIGDNQTLIISKKLPSFFDLLVTFSYLFVLYFTSLLLVVLLQNIRKLGKGIELNLKNKIHFSIISILLLSLILIGGGTVFFTIKAYESRHYESLSEKLRSVYVELDHKLAHYDYLDLSWSTDTYESLDRLLIKFSDVFYTDINLFDPEGNLLASSRREIFDLGLTGNIMNYKAFTELSQEHKAEFVHKEQIGKLSYISAYTPFLNNNNQLLAYLNLPYFTKQGMLEKEITTLIVAIINIYVLLILITIAISVFISDSITKPLRMIQLKFSEIELGSKQEIIRYTGKDEIGSLVNEYNRMVVVLEKSINLLAKSERESAWREMAKQIAHEIKNPLTPMKLSVQHLVRAWNDKVENYDEFLDKMAVNLIEQIDNLSAIATEFSNFAKMPQAKIEKVDIVKKLNNAVLLFANTQNIEIILKLNKHKSAFIKGDKEQISRVFINIIKNSIQSIPENRKGKISIELLKEKQNVVVHISDNGRGIPKEMQDKLFEPNFTTKTSGMGLGLAIVNNIIKNFKGELTYNTEVNRGTTFIIRFPAL